MRALAAILLLTLSAAAFAETDRNVHEIPGAGVSLTKPDGWRFELNTANIGVVQNPADGSVFTVIFQAMPTPPPDSAPELLGYSVKGVAAKYANFKIEEPIHATTVAGRHAAELTASYTHTAGKTTMPLRLRLLLIPREGGIVVINMVTGPDGDAATGRKLTSILDSLKIAK